MNPEKPVIYIVLGSAGAGRREIVADLIEGGLDASESPVVFLPADEPEHERDADFVRVLRWQAAELPEGGLKIEAVWPEDAAVGFLVVNGRSNPVDQIEALKPWIQAQGAELARVITVMDCRLVSDQGSLLTWYDACVHFSDILLLNRREGVENKWLSELRTHYEKKCLPCLIELVKKGRVANPALVLEPQARRLSHWFDEEEAHWTAGLDLDEDVVIEDEAEDDSEDEDGEEMDEYFVRQVSGRREREIPDIGKYLPSV